MKPTSINAIRAIPVAARSVRRDEPLRPLTVSVRAAGQILGIGLTKTWELIGRGDLKTVRIGRRRLVVYGSIEALATPADQGGNDDQ